MWGPQAKQYVQNLDHDLLGLAETHVVVEEALAFRRWMRKIGSKSILTHVVPTTLEGKCSSGGVALCPDAALDIAQLFAAECSALNDWHVVWWNLRGESLIVIMLYLDAQGGLGCPANVCKLTQIAALLSLFPEWPLECSATLTTHRNSLTRKVG